MNHYTMSLVTAVNIHVGIRNDVGDIYKLRMMRAHIQLVSYKVLTLLTRTIYIHIFLRNITSVISYFVRLLKLFSPQQHTGGVVDSPVFKIQKQTVLNKETCILNFI